MEEIKSFIKKNGVKYSVRSNRDRFFFPGEWMKFMDSLKNKQRFTFKFLLNTGARINEARNVKVCDCDLERKRIILRVTKVKAAKKEKNPRPRIIPISSSLAKDIKKHINELNLKDSDFLGIMNTPAANIGLKKALLRCGVKDWYMFSVHNVRKTLECWLMALDIDGLKIIAHIGHSMNVAAQNYISADVFSWDEKKQIRMIIGDLYER